VPPEPTTPPEPTATPEPVPPAALKISSTAFEHEGVIPDLYSCFGDNLSPALEWSGVPADAQSLLLFFHDPDAGFESGASVEPGFVHWVVFNIPPAATGYPENMPAGDTLDDGASQGSNDFAPYGEGTFPGGAPIKLIGYDGPCPGDEHRYVFALYALDALLDLEAGAVPADVLAAMEGHVLAEAELMGRFAPPD
jgi:Raf kinase inhibitor-like YbhB/YbcL family protein